MNNLQWLFFLLYLIIFFFVAYLWTFALASIKPIKDSPEDSKFLKFAIAIPAHDEEGVIASTIQTLKQLAYPIEHFDIFVVADFCTDSTAINAQSAGAICYERKSGKRGGKGEALAWLFNQILIAESKYDAVVIFDADTLVDKDFLYYINNRMNNGAKVVQGKHVISNPEAGWYPALAWALMTIDNRFSNHGRHNLGLSAKHMGDSICFRSDILERLGWGSGLTEDHEFRLRLLLEGIKIGYEPNAVGYGQAPLTWKEAQAQRLRWLKGVSDSGNHFRWQLLWSGIKNLNYSQIDGSIGSSIPSYSTLTLITLVTVVYSFLVDSLGISFYRIIGVVIFGILFLYPFLGLILDRAPLKAFLVILTGPFFMIWRSWLRLRTLFFGGKINWVRTPHR